MILLQTKYPQKILTDKIEVVIIELKKVKDFYAKNKNNEKAQWMLFLDNPNSKEVSDIMKTNTNIKEAIVTVHELSGDEKVRKLADLREKAIMDEKAIYRAGLENGEKRGFINGEITGRKQEKIKIAKELLNLNVSIDTIIKSTELTEEEIKNLK